MNSNTKKITAIAALLSILFVLPLASIPAQAKSPWTAELVWGDGVQWSMQAPPANLGNVNPHAPDELYIVAPQTSTPQSPVNNDHIPGVAHDHVVSVPAHNSGSYNAIWHVYVVACTPGNGACSGPTVTFPGPGGPGTGPTLVLAKTVNGNPLQSDAAVNAALASGAAFEIDTGIVFLCTVHAIH